MPITGFTKEEASKGGLSNLDAHIRDPRFTLKEFEYEGKKNTVVQLSINFEDLEGGDHPWSYQVGNAEYIKIVDEEGGPALEEGPMIEGVDRHYSWNPKSEFGLFIEALIDLGYDMGALGGDITGLDGLGVHMESKTFDKKQGGTKNVPLPSMLLEDEAPKKGKKATPPAKAASKAKAAPVADDDEDGDEEVSVDDLAIATAMKILTKPAKFITGYDGDGEVALTDLATAAFVSLKGNPHKAAVVALLKDAKFFKANDEFTYDAKTKTVSLGE